MFCHSVASTTAIILRHAATQKETQEGGFEFGMKRGSQVELLEDLCLAGEVNQVVNITHSTTCWWIMIGQILHLVFLPQD